MTEPAGPLERHPPGVYLLRFCTLNRKLSRVDQLVFAAGDGLPSGAALPVEAPVVIVRKPSGALSEYKGSEVVSDGSGLYHVTVEMLEEGEWVWEGQGQTSAGALLTSTGEIPWLIGSALKL